MKYILTEKEYAALKDVKRKLSGKEREELQELCTLAANSIPVPVYGSPNKKLLGVVF